MRPAPNDPRARPAALALALAVVAALWGASAPATAATSDVLSVSSRATAARHRCKCGSVCHTGACCCSGAPAPQAAAETRGPRPCVGPAPCGGEDLPGGAPGRPAVLLTPAGPRPQRVAAYAARRPEPLRPSDPADADDDPPEPLPSA